MSNPIKCLYDRTIFTIYLFIYFKPRASSIFHPLVDVWSVAATRGVWKDTAGCRERQVGVLCEREATRCCEV